MKQLRKRIIRLLAEGAVQKEEGEKLEELIKIKRRNPHCIRHSATCYDSDFLPEYALKKKVRWSMNSKQGARYINTRMGDELKIKILEHNGIIDLESKTKKLGFSTCYRCNWTKVTPLVQDGVGVDVWVVSQRPVSGFRLYSNTNNNIVNKKGFRKLIVEQLSIMLLCDCYCYCFNRTILWFIGCRFRFF